MKDEYKGLDFEEVKQTIANHCSFSLAHNAILNQEPIFNSLLVQRNLKQGSDAQKLYQNHGAPSFAGVHDFYQVLKDIEKGKIVSPQELLELSVFMSASKSMKTYMQKSEVEASSVEDLIASLKKHESLRSLIEANISNSGEVKDSASETLHTIRKKIKQCEQEITKKTAELLSKHSSILMEDITTTRNNRTTLLVKSGDKHKIKGFIHDESASGQAVYIEPEALLVLNNQLQSLRANEKNEVARILKELCDYIVPEVASLIANLDTLTILDSLFAKAKWASQKFATYADVVDDGEALYFKDARHPLIDDKKVVSNTYEIKPPYHHLIISGSNTGGKTVSLKVIGLFTIMSMSGFPIPCEESVIPMFDQVFVDVGDFQSILESLSTFSAHISKLAKIVDNATSKSLVLLDELGSGTDPKEGECLAIAILEYLKKNKIMSVATTHYSKVKEYAKAQDEILLSSVGFDLQAMQPTYKYMSGFSGNSNALEIAERYNLHPEILSEAYKLRENSYSEQERLIEKLESDRLLLDEHFDRLSEEKATLLKDKEQFEETIKKQKLSQEKITEEAYEKAQQILDDATLQAKEVLESLRNMKQVKEHEAIEVISKLKAKPEIEEESKTDEVFNVGDYVQIKGLMSHGEIISIRGNKATVLTNGIRMNVKVSELEHTYRPKVKKEVNVSSKSFSKTVKMECNVIGMRVSEALPVVEKYLDTAMYHKRSMVTIVHGSGTGALRGAIHEFLKKQSYVQEYRLGGEHEGGLGATVVTLKGKKNG